MVSDFDAHAERCTERAAKSWVVNNRIDVFVSWFARESPSIAQGGPSGSNGGVGRLVAVVVIAGRRDSRLAVDVKAGRRVSRL